MDMRTQAVKDYIRKHETMFWYTPEDKSEKVTDSLLVETILNYGTLDDIKALFEVMGLQQVAAIFRQMTGRKKKNIYPELWNYFDLYFSKHVPASS
jgi:hypothetical protein